MSRWRRKSHREQLEDDRRQYLLARMGHQWSTGEGPTVCTRCGHRYTATNAGRFCPKRTKKPNRWRIHFQRAQARKHFPAERRIPGEASIRAQLEQLERDAKNQYYDSADGNGRKRRHRYARIADEQQWWKFSRDARRYRKLLSMWWALPLTTIGRLEVTPDRSRWPGIFTRGRRKLEERIRKEQRRTIVDGGTTYTIYPQAKDYRGVPLFPEAYGVEVEEAPTVGVDGL